MYVYHYCLLAKGGRYISGVIESAIQIENSQSYDVLNNLIVDKCDCSDVECAIISLSLIGSTNAD